MKIAILGAGGIAKIMADTINQIDGIENYAVGSRDYSKAKEFAAEYGFQKAYGSYEELVQDKEIDLIYIATPHSHHYQHSKLCLENGQNILCEKAFMVNEAQAKEIVALGQEKRLFVGEAIWTRYMPMRQTINDVIASGVIGDVVSITANLGYQIDHVPRILKSELAGGALLDLGVYLINFASMILGNQIQNIQATGMITEEGVDSQNSIVLTYPQGKMAILHTTTKANTDREGVIYGTEGYLKIENVNNYEKIHIYNKQYQLTKTIEAPKNINGYEYQVLAAKKAIEEGKIECNEMPHDESVLMMKIMDDIRKQWGVTYLCE